MCDEMMEKKQEFCRTRNVIAITNRKLCDRPFEEQIRRVCSLHPKAVILREKDLTEEAYRECAKRVKVICDFYKVPCIFHTFWNVAMAEGGGFASSSISLAAGNLAIEKSCCAEFISKDWDIHSFRN